MKKVIRNMLIMAAWAVMVATIALHTTYERWLDFLLFTKVDVNAAYLRPLDFVLIFAVSVLVGAVLLEPESIVLCYVGTLGLTAVIMYFALTLPVTMGKATAGILIQMQALSSTVSNLLLGPVVILLVAGLLGGSLAERLIY